MLTHFCSSPRCSSKRRKRGLPEPHPFCPLGKLLDCVVLDGSTSTLTVGSVVVSTCLVATTDFTHSHNVGFVFCLVLCLVHVSIMALPSDNEGVLSHYSFYWMELLVNYENCGGNYK